VTCFLLPDKIPSTNLGEKSGLATLLRIKVKTNKSLEVQHVYAAQLFLLFQRDTAAVARAAFPKGNLYLKIPLAASIKSKSLHHYFQTFDSEGATLAMEKLLESCRVSPKSFFLNLLLTLSKYIASIL